VDVVGADDVMAARDRTVREEARGELPVDHLLHLLVEAARDGGVVATHDAEGGLAHQVDLEAEAHRLLDHHGGRDHRAVARSRASNGAIISG
jgi:hypothetical protein